jgi:AraC-like DNA-binding protein
MESTRYHTRVELPGVQVLEVVDSQRPWRCVSSGFELMLPETWRGQVAYRGARHEVGPGMLFCPGPDDAFEIVRAREPGSFRVLMIEQNALREGIAEQGVTPERLRFRRVVPSVRDELAGALRRLLDDVRSGAPALKLQSSMEELKAALVSDLSGSPSKALRASGETMARHIRELLHADVDGQLADDGEAELDLESLARRTGLSRFQVVRRFKLAYGLPPYTYQLHLRIARAQRLLSAGHTPAEVANELRFVDQSHLTRHFKRIVGVTPSVYAQGKQR